MVVVVIYPIWLRTGNGRISGLCAAPCENAQIALVTHLAPRGLSGNELARALISLQDRLPPARRNLLAMHGRTIRQGHFSQFCHVRQGQ